MWANEREIKGKVDELDQLVAVVVSMFKIHMAVYLSVCIHAVPTDHFTIMESEKPTIQNHPVDGF